MGWSIDCATPIGHDGFRLKFEEEYYVKIYNESGRALASIIIFEEILEQVKEKIERNKRLL